MASLTPSSAANLASRIYDIQDPTLVDLFLKLPYFKRADNSSLSPAKYLTASVGGRLLLNYKDGFGVCAEGGENNKGEIFLIFRGTTTANHGADILTDARIGLSFTKSGLPVHCGFQHCFNSMLPAMRQFFNAHRGGVTTVHCIGHSLGGAIASLAADWVARALKLPTKLYTFGAPRVGSELFAKSTTAMIGGVNIHRVYHRTDPVTLVPLYPFMHAPYHQRAHYLHSTQPLTSGTAHFISNYILSVKGKSWQQLNDAPDQPYTIEFALECWLKSKLPDNTASPQFWRWVESAFIYIFKKMSISTLLGMQAACIGTFTLADRIAYSLEKAIHMAENISSLVERLMRKIMRALGMTLVKTQKELTRSLMRYVLVRLSEKANKEARDVLRKL